MNSENIQTKIQVLRAKLKKHGYIMILLLAGLVLILWPSGEKEKSGNAEKTHQTDTLMFSLDEQEAQLTEILSEISGAGNVHVLLTVKTGTERVIASNSEMLEESDDSGGKSRELSESAVILSGSGNTDEAVTLKYIYPEYQGAVVVAEGAGIQEVKLGITRAVAAATGLPSDKITVLKMK